MTLTETYTAPRPPQEVEERWLPALQPTPIAAGSYLPESDPAVNQLRVHGVDGQVVTELKMGGQMFAVVDVSKCQQVQGGYYPFSRRDAVKDGTPNLWKFAEGDRPLVLMHYDESGAMVGRALRADSPMLIGREAAAKDPGASRFNLGHDDTVSRDHASIAYDKANDRIIITDRESTNGTRVRQVTPNRQPAVPNQPQPAPADPYEHVATPDESSEMPLTREVMQLGDFTPEQKVKAGDREFYLSKVIDGRYNVAVMYAAIYVDGKQRVVPRLLYKSQSDGGWRATYGIEHSGRFVKEAEGQAFNHYTQETKLHPDIVDALERASTLQDPEDKKLKQVRELFKEANETAAETNTSKSEIRYSHDPAVDGKLAPLRLVSAGYLSNRDLGRVERYGNAGTFAEYYRSMDQIFAELHGFMPDFTTAPRETHQREHTLLGPINVEDYDATINGQPIIWSMATDGQGRVWIDNIRFTQSPTSSYGTYAKVFDGGLLTNKPLEYRSQLGGVRQGEWNDFDGQYADITPLIGQLLPVRQYRQAKLAR